jgi:DNA-binding transcriptional LysR family regulator
MIFSLREMEVFRLIMEKGSITGAAAALGVSQPSVSKTLQQAEERLGFKLFTRQRKRLIPTTEADTLFPETLGAFAAIEVVQRLAGDLRTGRSGLLRIAVTPTLAHGLAPRAVALFCGERPKAKVDFQVAGIREATRLVLDHRVDFGLILGTVGDPRLIVRDVIALPLGCVLPKDHPLCRKKVIRPRDLEGHSIISVSRDSPAGESIVRAFEAENVPLSLAIETNQSSVATALAAAGVGVAVLEGFSVLAAASQGLQTRPFAPRVMLYARILFSREKALSNLASGFLEALERSARIADVAVKPD